VGQRWAFPADRRFMTSTTPRLHQTRGLLCACALVTALPVIYSTPESGPIPKPAVEAILGEFATHSLVAIAEAHRNQQVHDFIVTLVSDPRFAQVVDDVVVEFGTARHQDIIDRYIAGDNVPIEELRLVWRDTVNILVWDAPVYERFFQTIRTVNQRNHERRLRVLLADPAVDWEHIRHDDWERVASIRDEFAAALVEREVLSKGRRALLIFGSGHVTRDSAFGPVAGRKPNLAESLAARHAGSILLVWAHMPGWYTDKLDPRLSTWRQPALATLKGTWLGASGVGPPGSPTLEQLADSFLYLGPIRVLTTSTPPERLYDDPSYLRELLRRDQIQGGFNAKELERLRQKHLKNWTGFYKVRRTRSLHGHPQPLAVQLVQQPHDVVRGQLHEHRRHLRMERIAQLTLDALHRRHETLLLPGELLLCHDAVGQRARE